MMMNSSSLRMHTWNISNKDLPLNEKLRVLGKLLRIKYSAWLKHYYFHCGLKLGPGDKITQYSETG